MTGTPKAELDVSEALVAALVADQHPQFAGLALVRAGEGWDNFTFRLGSDLAVRLPRRAVAVPLIENEQRWLGDIARLVPLPAPAPVAIGMAGDGYPWPWSIVPWIMGTPVDQAPLALDQGPALARFLSALHQPAPEAAPANPVRGVPLATRREKIVACLDRLAAITDLITPGLRAAWDEALAAPFPSERVWLHGDLHGQNVLSREGRICGVIDWGDMCAGDAAVDLGALWGLLDSAAARAEALAAYAPDEHLLARARGWAIVFGASLADFGRIDDPRHAALGDAILRRLAEDCTA